MWPYVQGTPPRAWGKQRAAAISKPLLRYTPTCVGKTIVRIGVGPILKVHPHVRGENRRHLAIPQTAIGTPPRAWGKRDPDRPDRLHNRYTPTCVGKTSYWSSSASCTAVHPHVRGENSDDDLRAIADSRYTPTCVGKTNIGKSDLTLKSGTPPRAWGKRNLSKPFCDLIRYTPTCVGKTSPGCIPRRRATGTPPRAWGKHLIFSCCLCLFRYTPTCVGKT